MRVEAFQNAVSSSAKVLPSVESWLSPGSIRTVAMLEMLPETSATCTIAGVGGALRPLSD